MPPAAAWCSLCYGRLSEDAAPDPFTAPLESLEPFEQPVESLPALAVTDPAPVPVLPEPREAAPAYEESTHLSPVSLAERPAGWPCRGCHALVSLDLMACPTCGAPFLPSDVAVTLPVVGDPRSLSSGMKIAIMAGGSTAIALVVFLVFLLLGSVL